VTNAITQAQIKVEAQHFDARKRALEFDDVLNQQRNVIYAQRRKILEQGDVSETVLEFLHEEAAALASAEAEVHAEERDVEKLRAALGGLLAREIPASRLEDAGDDLLGRVAELVNEAYEEKETEVGEDLMRQIERWVLLRSIDTHWVEHLTQIEELREGIHLRGYGQQDPLIAYKNEARRYWDELQGRLAQSAAQMILRVTVRPAEQQQERQDERHTRHTQGTASGGGLERPAGGPAKSDESGKKLGRNDPCYCGSGKKYKKCHGR
jgi:preprotein translocase subunit SecA